MQVSFGLIQCIIDIDSNFDVNLIHKKEKYVKCF